MPVDQTNLIIIPDEDDATMYAFNYLVKKLQKHTEDEIAADFGCTRQTLANRRAQWEAVGAIRRARELLIAPVVEDNEMAYLRAAMEMPALIERVITIAKTSQYERVALEAVMFLEARIVNRVMEQKAEPGAAESAYADKPGDYDPTVIRRLSGV